MLAMLLAGTRKEPRVEVGDVPFPDNVPGRLVIRVMAAGITRMEPHWSTGWQLPDGSKQALPLSIGPEFAGHVVSIGQGVKGFHVGQNVFGSAEPYRQGAMAEMVSATAACLLPMPDGLTFEAAATLPLAGLTACQAMIRYGDVKPGQRVLIHGGAGGVGTFATQIARHAGAYIIVTAGAGDKALCKELGAHEVIDYTNERFEDRVDEIDLVFDQIGGDTQERSWGVLKRGGKLIAIAGEETDAPDQERASALGVSARWLLVDTNLIEMQQLVDLVIAGNVRPIVGKAFDLSFGEGAFSEGGGRFAGKAVMICS